MFRYILWFTIPCIISCHIFRSTQTSISDIPKDEAPVSFASTEDSLLFMHPGKSLITGILLVDTLSKTRQPKKPFQNDSGKYLIMANSDLLIYEAQNPGATANYRTQSDDEGRFHAIVNPGRYFAFAFRLDPMSFGLMKAKTPEFETFADKVTLLGKLKPYNK